MQCQEGRRVACPTTQDDTEGRGKVPMGFAASGRCECTAHTHTHQSGTVETLEQSRAQLVSVSLRPQMPSPQKPPAPSHAPQSKGQLLHSSLYAGRPVHTPSPHLPRPLRAPQSAWQRTAPSGGMAV